jgi:transposase
MFERHKIAIANSLCHKQSNAFAERMNGSIQELKCIAKGFRNTDNFRTAILFHFGKLELFPH